MISNKDKVAYFQWMNISNHSSFDVLKISLYDKAYRLKKNGDERKFHEIITDFLANLNN